jgi:hypothetical protein
VAAAATVAAAAEAASMAAVRPASEAAAAEAAAAEAAEVSSTAAAAAAAAERRRKAGDCGMSSSLSSSRSGGSSSPLSLPLWLPLVSPASSCRTCGVSSPARAYSSGHRAARPPPAAAQCLRSAEPVRPANTGGSPTSSLAIARPNATAVASEMRKSCCRLGALSRLCASCSDLMLEELRVVRRCP